MNATAGLTGCRVCIVQPALPAYRVPVFNQLVTAHGIDLTIAAEFRPIWGSLKSVRGDGTFRTIEAPISIWNGLMRQPKQLELARHGAFDVIIFPLNRKSLDVDLALRAARRRGIGTVLWGHGFSKRESWLRRSLRNNLLRKADAGLLYSSAARDRLMAEGLDPARLFVAQNAIDHRRVEAAIHSWSDDAGRLAEFRRQHLLEHGETILFISRMEPDKHVEVLIDAFALLLRRRPRARLVLVGDGSCVPDLQQRARAAGLGASVTFTGPIYDEDALAPWAMSAACFVYPAAIGLSIYHAFAYGLPVLTSDDIASHNPEIEALEPGVNGLLVRDGDPTAFADAMERVIGDPDARDRFRKAAHATIHRPGGFTIDTMAQGFADAISAVRSR
ncbi:MAG: glycosyltransferase family 4 protein [Bacteroidia bacterium]|nr:glycosyltransferase family 4 protein [Bacteroidia bacterium]